MLNNILEVVKDAAIGVVSENTNIPKDKRNQIVDTAASTIASGFAHNLGGLTSILEGTGGNSTFVDGIQKSVVTSLSEKVGLNRSVAGGLASSIIPAVISALSGKVGSKEDNGFSVESIVGALSGDSKKKGGGILGALAGLFGK